MNWPEQAREPVPKLRCGRPVISRSSGGSTLFSHLSGSNLPASVPKWFTSILGQHLSSESGVCIIIPWFPACALINTIVLAGITAPCQVTSVTVFLGRLMELTV